MTTIRRRSARGEADSWLWPSDLHPVLRRIYARRAIDSPGELELGLAGLVPVGRFRSLAAAVDLLLRHRERSVLIVGDFDADGATSTALMLLGLKQLGFAEVRFFVPDRFTLGYGLSPGAVERIASQAPSLLVTVDNGISSHDGVAAARARGIQVLVTDHHLPPESLPAADAIVNPNCPEEDFPCKHLAGVGVAFYLLAALAKRLGQPAVASELLDLVALGTVADLVPLDRNNRILIRQGVLRIRARRCRPGILALCEVAGVASADLTEAELGFQLGPRLNAAGRLEDMTLGIRCLTCEDPDEAAELARELDRLNRERRQIEARMKEEASVLIELPAADGATSPIACLFHEDWHEGVVGLVASRVKEQLHRPVIAFAPSGPALLKGSGRSVPGFHLRDALAEIDARYGGLIQRFGGHAMAAGLTLARGALEEFRAALATVGAKRLTPDMLAVGFDTDGELAADEHTLELATLLREAGPWGQAFPEPRFDGCFELLQMRVMQERHLRLQVRPAAGGDTLTAIAFNRPGAEWPAGSLLRIVYRLTVNDYNGRRRAQLVVEHIESAGDVEPSHAPAC